MPPTLKRLWISLLAARENKLSSVVGQLRCCSPGGRFRRRRRSLTALLAARQTSAVVDVHWALMSPRHHRLHHRAVHCELKGIVGYLRSRALQGKWEQQATFDLEPKLRSKGDRDRISSRKKVFHALPIIIIIKQPCNNAVITMIILR